LNDVDQVIYGINSVFAAINHSPERIVTLWVDQSRRDSRITELIDTAQHQNVTVTLASREEIDRHAGNNKHQGIAALCSLPSAMSEKAFLRMLEDLNEPAFLLILDQVKDPHNLGACLRTAEAAGVHAVITPKDNSAGLTPTVCKVASGAASRIPLVEVTNLSRFIKHLQEAGVWIMGTSGEGEETIYQSDLKGPLAIVLGAEGSGLRRLTKTRCDKMLRIPMADPAESLNVSVAAGVILFEAVRQRP